MRNFLSIFRSQMPDIIKRLESVRSDLHITQANIEQLVLLEKGKLSITEDEQAEFRGLRKAMMSSLDIALWAKDMQGRFIIVNKACCEKILKCSEQEALNLKNGDLANDALAKICMETDLKVMKSLTPRRFIENAVYEDGRNIFIDTVKSPLFRDGELIGTTGSAIDVTDEIPDEIKKQRTKSSSIEIPLDTTMNEEQFVKLLERRKVAR